jgi:hypothetical protein
VNAYSGIWVPPSSFLQGGGNCNCSERELLSWHYNWKHLQVYWIQVGLFRVHMMVKPSWKPSWSFFSCYHLVQVWVDGNRSIFFSGWRCLQIDTNTRTRVKSHSPYHAYLEWKVFQSNRLDYQEPLQYSTQTIMLMNLQGRRVLPYHICMWVCFNNLICWKIKTTTNFICTSLERTTQSII